MPVQAQIRPGILLAAALIGCWLASAAPRLPAAEPAPAAILESLRMTAFASRATLDGRIRHQGESTPVRIGIAPGRADYTFPGSDERIALRLADGGARLLRNGEPVRGDARLFSIAGSDLALGDLAFEFLYWSDAERLDDEKIMGLPTRQIRVKAPSRDALYAAVDIHVARQSGALLQIRCYNWDGQLVKRFKVVQGQRVDGRWMLRQMRIESYPPGSRRAASRSYLEIEQVESPATAPAG